MDRSDETELEKRPLGTADVVGSSTTCATSTIKRKRKSKSKKWVKRISSENSTTSPAPLIHDGVNGLDNDSNRLEESAHDQEDEPASKRVKQLQVSSIDGLRRLSNNDLGRINEGPEQAETRLEKMRGAVRTLLECVGEDPDREGLLATPSRYAEALLFLTQGYQANIESIINNALFREGHDEMIIVKNIEIYSLCEHHLVPFTGNVCFTISFTSCLYLKLIPRPQMHIGYVPSDTVIGLSKLPRIAEIFSRRLQIQERLTKQVAHAIMDILKPQGVAVVMESCHLCMVMRGVEKTSTTTITSCVLGCFEKDSKTRAEFFSLVGVNRV